MTDSEYPISNKDFPISNQKFPVTNAKIQRDLELQFRPSTTPLIIEHSLLDIGYSFLKISRLTPAARRVYRGFPLC